MRYPVVAIALAVVFAATAYVSFAFDNDSTAVRSELSNPPILNGLENPDNYTRTCSGDKPSFGAYTYFFGFSGPGMCTTLAMYANTYREARDCAQASCPDCRIEDITSWYHYSSSLYDPDLKEGYCPAP